MNAGGRSGNGGDECARDVRGQRAHLNWSRVTERRASACSTRLPNYASNARTNHGKIPTGRSCAPVAAACGGGGGAPIAQSSATPEVSRDTSPANIDPWQVTLASLTGAISWGGDAFRVRTDYERTPVVIRRSGYEDVLIFTGAAYVARADDAAPKEEAVKVHFSGSPTISPLGGWWRCRLFTVPCASAGLAGVMVRRRRRCRR